MPSRCDTGVSTSTAATGKFEVICLFCLTGAELFCRFNLSGAATVYLTSALSAEARSVFSQVKSGSSRPKCP